MPYKFTVYFRGMPKAISELRTLSNFVNREAGEKITKAAFNAAGDVFDRNFETEGRAGGLGGWAALAERTQQEREALGFDANHPILFRYGDLRAVTAISLRDANGSDTFRSTDAQGKTINVTLTIGRRGGKATATGDKAWNQIPAPTARPFWFTTQPVTRAVRKSAGALMNDEIERLL